MIQEILNECKDKMDKAVEATREDFASVRTGRANPAMFQKIMVYYYGTPTPLGQLGGIQNPEARSILISPYDKSALKAIEAALQAMPNLGAQPNNDGNVIRLNLPELTEERRKELTKVVRHEGENAKVAVRNLRRDAITHLKEMLKKKEVSEDEEHRAQDDIQKLTDRFIGDIDKVVTDKEKEILTV